MALEDLFHDLSWCYHLSAGMDLAANLIVYTTLLQGEIPSPNDSDDDSVEDPTMHPDHQIALQDPVQIYTHEGMYLMA